MKTVLIALFICLRFSAFAGPGDGIKIGINKASHLPELRCEFSNQKSSNATIKFIDFSGKTVSTKSVQILPGSNTFSLSDVLIFPEGEYKIELFYNGKKLTTSFINWK